MTAMTITFAGFTGLLGKGVAPREMQCLLAIAGGATGKEAARALGMSEDGVKKRLLALTTKLGVTRRAALVAKAFAMGLIQPASAPTPNPKQQRDHDQYQGVFIA